MDGRANVSVKNITATSFHTGISINGGSGNSVLGSRANTNSWLGIDLANTSAATAYGNTTADNGYYGIYIYGGGSHKITGNETSGNATGIGVSTTGINTFTGNTIINNYSFGIDLDDANTANIFGNRFVGNTTQARVTGAFSGKFYYEGFYVSDRHGNYWDDYNSAADGCDDINSNGLCDAPYVFTGAQDIYPTVEPTTPLSSATIPAVVTARCF